MLCLTKPACRLRWLGNSISPNPPSIGNLLEIKRRLDLLIPNRHTGTMGNALLNLGEKPEFRNEVRKEKYAKTFI
jgi:hypothetical protein